MKLGLPIGHQGLITNIEFSQDERYMLSSSFDNTVILWDVQNARPLKIFYNACFARLSESKLNILIGNVFGEIEIWSISDLTLTWKGKASAIWVLDSYYNEANNILITLSDGIVKFWDVIDSIVTFELEFQECSIENMFINKEWTQLTVITEWCNAPLNILVYDVQTKIQLSNLPDENEKPIISCSPNGQYFATAGSFGFEVKVSIATLDESIA